MGGMAELANKNVSSHCAKIISSAFYHDDVQHLKQQHYHRHRDGTGKALLLKKVLYFTYLTHSYLQSHIWDAVKNVKFNYLIRALMG